jgi:hypothetical protein
MPFVIVILDMQGSLALSHSELIPKLWIWITVGVTSLAGDRNCDKAAQYRDGTQTG